MLAYAALRFVVVGALLGLGLGSGVGVSRAGFCSLPPQNLSQGSYCLCVCLVQLWEQLGCCGFVAFS